MCRKTFSQDESGVTLIIFAMTVALIIGMVSLVVDLGKQELALTQLRQSADASALSGARQLNGRPDGWRAAKASSVLVVKSYPIHGVNPAWRANLRLSAGDTSYWDSTPATGYSVNPPLTHTGVRGDSGAYHVTVERGLFRSRLDDPSKTEFISLEATGEDQVMSGDAYLFANAVRVKSKLDHLDGFFSRIFGSVGFDNLEVESIAVMDSEIEHVVAPIAIAYNDLMLDTRPQSPSATHQMPSFSPEFEYSRKVEISFMNKDGRQDMLNEPQSPDPGGPEFIDGGVERYRSFKRLPYAWFWSVADRPDLPIDSCFNGQYTGNNRNCKAVPLRAWFAMPNSDSINPELVVAGLRDGVRARVGDTVKGLSNLSTFAQDPALSRAVAGIINASDTTFDQFFRANNTELDNYPWLRAEQNGGIDQILQYPSDTKAPPGRPQKMQDFNMANMAKQGPGGAVSGLGIRNFINPMCHFPEIPLNDFTNNKVKKVWAMVVAPRRNTTNSGRKINYIDFPSMFSGAPQNSIAAVGETVPTVVGFVQIGFYDGNFLNLETLFPVSALPPPSNQDVFLRTATPRYGSFAANNYVYDNNPASLDMSDSSIAKNMESYASKVDQTYECYDKTDPGERDRCDAPTGPPPLDNLADILNCFNFRQFFGSGSFGLFDALLGNSLDVRVVCTSDEEECGVKRSSQCPGCSKGGGCCDRWSYGNGRSKITDVLFSMISNFHKGPIPSNPDTHCLYVLKRDSTDRNNLSDYHPLKAVKAGYGCGGLEGALAFVPKRADDSINIVSGQQWSRQNTTLVKVSN